MRRFTRCLCLALAALLSTAAHATIIRVQAQATVDNSQQDYFALGTVLHADVTFAVAGQTGTNASPIVSNLSGTFTWNDGTDHVFNVTGEQQLSVSSVGKIGLLFRGNGEQVRDLVPSMVINFQVAANPFATGYAWADLMPDASVFGLGVWLDRTTPGFLTGTIARTDVSYSITEAGANVPEPGSLALAVAGLLGLTLLRRRAS